MVVTYLVSCLDKINYTFFKIFKSKGRKLNLLGPCMLFKKVNTYGYVI